MSVPPSRLSIDLPEACVPLEGTFATESVEGPFGITAAVASFAEVLDWQEKRISPRQGYYRLVPPPQCRQLVAGLQAYYDLPEVLLFCSQRQGLAEVCDALCIDRDAQAVYIETRDPQRYADCATGLELRREAGPGIPHIRLLDQLPVDPRAVQGADYILCDLSSAAAPGLTCGVLLTRDVSLAATVFERNRRRGGVLSARNAAWFLGEDSVTLPDIGLPDRCAARLSALEQGGDTLFFPTGMAALTAVIETLRSPEHTRFIVVGHLYRDTHILFDEMPWTGAGVESIYLRPEQAGEIGKFIDDQCAAVFVETITNPLNEVPDLSLIVPAAHAAGLPVIVDNTMASPFNCRPFEYGADLVVHSSSKYLSGGNDHGGGVVLSMDPELLQQVQQVQDAWQLHMSPLEMQVLLARMEDFEKRMYRFNRNAQRVAEFLENHPAVERVYYAGLASSPAHEVFRKQLDGGGSVISFLLKDPSIDAVQRFFDAPLKGMYKAPSLGSNVSLFCPYTLLTYYDKTAAYLEQIRLPRHLLRLAIGCEPTIDPIIGTLGEALEKVSCG